eukprot:g9604.t1
MMWHGGQNSKIVQLQSSSMNFNRKKIKTQRQTYSGKENKEIFGNIKQTPLRLLLTFHHVSYDYVLDDGRTLMDNIMLAFQLGQENAENKILNVWKTLKTIFINNNDQERWENVYNKLNIGIGADTKNFTRSALNYFTD